ncbi:MAG: GNAT family N-acetyltransferase [Desulfobulbaceae bacterium]
MERKTITVSYLELRQGQKIQGKKRAVAGFRIEEVTVPCPAFNCFMYRAVGGQWFWIDKRNWSEEEWQNYVQSDTIQTWGAWLHGSPCGYFELEQRGAGRIEIAYLGILEQFSGCGLGKNLLLEALSIARGQGQQRITVNTCSLDHPAALANYLARGMTLYRQETLEKLFPEPPPLFWTG